MRKSHWLISLLVFAFTLITNGYAQTNYYIDAVLGNDANNGTTTSTPWKNLTKIYNSTFSPGSIINLKAGSVWTSQQLKFKGSGTLSSPIIVRQYGSGAKPIIHGNGLVGQGVVYLYNQQYIEINDLEITNSPNGPVNSDFFVGLYQNGNNPLGADRRGVMIAIDGFGTANHIWLKNLDVHHIKGQLGSGQTKVNGATPKRTGGVYFAVLDTFETASSKSRFNDILVDSCSIYYCENTGIALDNEWNVYYPGGENSSIAADRTEYANWYDRRFTNVKVSNNDIHHIGKNAMIIRCTDETGLIERNVCYETALGTTGNTMFTARAKGTVFQYNEGYFNRSTTQNVDPGNIDGCMYDPDFGSVGIIFQYSYSHDNSEGIYWGCNTRGANNNTTGIPDPGDVGCTLRYCISQNDKGDLVYFNYSSAGNEIYNNVFFIGSGLSPNIIHENSGNRHTYNFFNNIIYNLSSATSGADYAFGTDPTYPQIRNISHNIFYGNHHSTEPSDPFKLLSDPNFINPGSGTIGTNTLIGYKINAGSSAIGSGRLISNNGGFDYFNNPVSSASNPNRGAYEGLGVGALPPTISSFSPSTAVAGAPITIRGTKFTGTSSVIFGATPAASFTVVSDSVITAVVGNGSTGNIVVTNSIGSDTSSSVFNYCIRPAAPTASGLTICPGSTATLTATGVGTLSWYTAASGGTKITNGNTYTTPILFVPTTYYVQDSTCAASATRTPVTVSFYPTNGEKTVQNACDSFIWKGVKYTSSGTYYQSIINSYGCPAYDTVILVIKRSSSSRIIVTACDRYLWNGNVYTQSGEYVVHTTNSVGCDSAITLLLTIKPISTSIVVDTACGSYDWHGNHYTQSTTTATWTGTNSVGCDSIVTLHLTILPKPNAGYITGPTSVCVGDTALFIAPDADTLNNSWIVYYQPPAEPNNNLFIFSNNTQMGIANIDFDTSLKIISNVSTQIAVEYKVVGVNGCESSAAFGPVQVMDGLHQSIIQSACDSFEWHGNVYHSSGDYVYHYISPANGCPSADTLHLTIHSSSTTIVTDTACGLYEWHGIHYTQSTTATWTGVNSVGCDSIVTLHLTILPKPSAGTISGPTSVCVGDTALLIAHDAHSTYVGWGINYLAPAEPNVNFFAFSKNVQMGVGPAEFDTTLKLVSNVATQFQVQFVVMDSNGCTDASSFGPIIVMDGSHQSFSQTACGSYEWHGTVYTISGDYVYHYTSPANGCPSADTLHLTIIPIEHHLYTQTACDSFVWHGAVYKTSGTYQYIYNLTQPCPSRDTLALTIISSTHNKQMVTSCGSYIWNGQTYNTSGTYVYAYTNTNGCPSADTLVLIVAQPTYQSQTITRCGSYNWNGITYSNSGDYVYAYTNASGCPSADTLHLTIYCTYSYALPTNIDAGFENQTTGNLSSANPNTSATQWSFVTSGNGQVRSISATGGYGGPKYLSVGKNAPTSNTSTTANSNILSTNTFLQNTKYISQFHYKRNTGTPDTGSFVFISMDGTSGARDQSSISLGTPTNWTKFTKVITTNGSTTPTTSGVAGINIKIVGSANGTNSAVVDVDNFVLYPADNQTNPLPDTIAPQAPASFTLNGANTSISLNWTAPSFGTDGGGYLLLRYTSNPSEEPAPLQNAVYATNGTIGNGQIIYQGTATTFTDAGLTSCATYWYRIYTRDKAYNYSMASSGSTKASTLNNFNPLLDSITTCSSAQTLNAGLGYSSYLWNTGSTQTSITINQSGKYKVTVTNSAGCTNADSVYVRFKSSTNSTVSINSCTSVTWNGQMYSQSGTYTYVTNNASGCDSMAYLQLTINPCSPQLLVKALMEGYYVGGGRMRPNLYEMELSTDSTAVDSVEISLWHPDSLGRSMPTFRNKYIINNVGNMTLSLPSGLLGKLFYIALKHKNSVETWSANSVNITLSTSFDFTTASNRAFGDGINPPQKNLGSGVYGMYSGDVNDDGAVDLLDMIEVDNDASLFEFGYNPTDCNGDGATDLLDMILLDNNSAGFIFGARPF